MGAVNLASEDFWNNKPIFLDVVLLINSLNPRFSINFIIKSEVK